MTSEACCREFQPKGRSKECPHSGFNNGRGWWPRTNDIAGRTAAEQREKQKKREQLAVERARRRELRLQGVLTHA